MGQKCVAVNYRVGMRQGWLKEEAESVEVERKRSGQESRRRRRALGAEEAVVCKEATGYSLKKDDLAAARV